MNLTTVAAVKQYLAITTSTQDSLIASLIARESAHIQNWTGRQFPIVSNTSKRLNGTGTSRLVLPDQPILAISALSVLNATIPASPDGVQAGYIYDDSCIYLVGGGTWGDRFPRGYQNVNVSWTAGYAASETDWVPTAAIPLLTPTEGGTAHTVVSVIDTQSGLSLTQVGGSPSTGQFSFLAGAFTFSAADSGAPVTMSYYYIPSPVEQAVIEMIGLDLQQRSNIGINSKSLATETVTYEKKGMTDSAKELLEPYRRRMVA